MRRQASELGLQLQRLLLPRATAAHILVTGVLMAWSWSHWHAMAVIAAVMVARAAVQPLLPWLIARFGAGSAVGHGIAALHLLFSLIAAHAAGWSLPARLLLLFEVLTIASFQEGGGRRWAALATGTGLLVASFDGLPAPDVAVLGLFCGLVFVIAEARTLALDEALLVLGAKHDQLVAAIAELEQMHGAMVAQEKLSSLGLLAAGVAHEINNPMAFVTSNVRTLLDELKAGSLDGAAQREYIDDVLPATLDGIHRVNTIVADLRRFARGEPEGAIDFELNEEVLAGARICQNQLKHTCKLELDLGSVPRVHGRPQQIAQVLVNLVMNAGQAMCRYGTVRVGTSYHSGQVRLIVEDDGCGMDEATLNRLFQPFFTTKPVGQGTGLGLAVAHGIVQSHGGRIDVQSTPGRGTTFTVWLPKADLTCRAT